MLKRILRRTLGIVGEQRLYAYPNRSHVRGDRASRADWRFDILEDRTVPALIAYEPFNYYVPSNAVDSTIADPAAVSLLGQGPGAGNSSTVGLTGTWTNDGPGTDLVVAGSLGYPTYPTYQGTNGTNVTNYDFGSGVPSGALPVGNSAISNGIVSRGTLAQNEIALTSTFGDSTVSGSGTYYVSFLITPGLNAHIASVQFPQAVSLISTDVDHKDIDIGWTNGNKVAAGNSSQIFSGSATGITFNQTVTLANFQAITMHLVAAVTFTPGSNTTVSLYLNPGFGTTPAAGSLITTADLGADYHDIGAIGLKDASRAWIDEIRIAGTYSELWSDPQARGASPTLAAQSSDPRFNGIRVPDVSDAVRNGANNGTIADGSANVNVVALGGGVNNITNAGLFKFSDGSATGLSNLVPAGFNIASAKVILTGLYPQPYAGATLIPTTAYNITSSWNDSAANPNPTIDTSVSVATGAGTAANGRYTYDVTGLAQQWLSGVVANNGIAIAQTGSGALNFFSREWTNNSAQGYFVGVGDRPTLVLTLARNTGIGISSNGGGSAASSNANINLPVNTTAVTTVTVANPTGQTLAYSLTGTDAGLFSISAGGVLTFNTAPTAPALYGVTVNVTGTGGSGNTTASQTLAVKVTPEGVPTLDAIANASLPMNSSAQTVNLTGISNPNASTSGIISVNFTDNTAGSTLTNTQTPGVIPVANWNNKSAGAAAAVNDSAGAATGVTVAYAGSTTTNMFSAAYSVQPGSTSAANNALMGGGVPSGNTITLANLNAQFPNGYDVYVYLAPQYSYSNGKGVVSDGTTSLNYNVIGTSFSAFGQSTGYNAPGNYVVFTNKSANTLALTNTPSANAWNTSGFQTTYITGIQIVPRGAPLPLSITTTSSNTALIPQAAVTYTAGSSTASLAYTPATGMSGSSTISVNVSDGNYVTTKTFTVTVTASLPNPTLDTIADATINEDSSQQTVNLTGISDGHSGTDTLVVTATSDNQSLVSNGNIGITYTSPSATGTLTYTPTALQFGTANITVKVKNTTNNQEFTRTFLVTVTHVNHAPTLNAIADLPIYIDSPMQTVNLTGISPGLGGDIESVTVSATSDNPSIVPNPDVSYVSGSTGSISFTPTGTVGSAHVTVTVSDGSLQTQRTFLVTVALRYTTLDPINNTSINEDSTGNAVSFTGIAVQGYTAPPPRVVSINIEDSGNTISAASVAGAFSATNWNNVPTNYVGTPYGGTIVTNSGTTTGIGVQMSGNSPNSTENVSGTSANAVMMSGSGVRSIYNLGTINYYAQVQLSNLASLFGSAGGGATTSHYDVYVYYGTGYNGNFMGGSGSIVASSGEYTNATSDTPSTTILKTAPYATMRGTSAGFADSTYTYSDTTYTGGVSGTGFILSQGTGPGNRGNYVKLTDLSSDNLVITPVVNPASYGWNTCAILGIQIVEASASPTVTVTATSSDTTLVPNPVVSYVTPNSTGSLAIAPAANRYGTATITVTASSAGTTSTVRTFDVTVNNVNDAPTLDAIPDVTINEDAGLQTYGLTGITPGPFETENVTVTATSDNQTLLPDGNISILYSNPGTTGTLSYTPAANRSGTANVTVTVSDGSLTTTRRFKIVVSEVNDPPTLDAISNVTVPADSGAQNVNLTGITAGPFETAGAPGDVQKIVSINIEDSGYVLSAANSAGVVAAPNWNNVPVNTNGTPYAGTVVTSTGASTGIGVKMSGRGANTPESVSGSSPNAMMMAGSGIQSMYNFNTVNYYAQVQLTNLAAVFGNAASANYDVYVYYGVGYNGTFMGGTGDMIASSGEYTNDTSDFPTTTILQTVPYTTMRGTATGLSDATYTYSDTANYTGGVTGSGFIQSLGKSNSNKGNYVKFSNLNVDTLVITAKDAPSGAQWNTCAIVGIQIVDHSIPQPMTVTAVSDNPALIPNPTVNYVAPATSGSLTYTPTAGLSGTANVTVTVSDGQLTTQQQFQIHVAAAAPTVTQVAPFVGPTGGGNTIVITGTNFVGIDPAHVSSSVKFGSGSTFADALSYTVNSASQITAVAPAGTNTVNVVVTSPAGSSANDSTSGGTGTTANDYTYVTPAVTSVVVNGAPMQTMTSPGWLSGVTSITVNTTAGLTVGEQLSSLGAGFPNTATIASITNPTTFVISSPTTAAQGATTSIRATPLPLKAGGFSMNGQWLQGETTIYVDSTANLLVGQYVSSSSNAFPASAVITQILDSTSFSIDVPTLLDQVDPAPIQIANSVAARDRYGNLASLSGQTSVVQNLLVTFNTRVTLDQNPDGTSAAFSIDSLAASLTHSVAIPATAAVAVTAVGIPGTGNDATGYTQYVLNFSAGGSVESRSNAGSGASGNTFTLLKDGYYRLNTTGSKVHAGVDTVANRSDPFYALYAAVNPADVTASTSLGDGQSKLLVDGVSLGEMYAAFGSFANTAGPPSYNLAYDWNLDGIVDGIDLGKMYANFGSIWQF